VLALAWGCSKRGGAGGSVVGSGGGNAVGAGSGSVASGSGGAAPAAPLVELPAAAVEDTRPVTATRFLLVRADAHVLEGEVPAAARTADGIELARLAPRKPEAHAAAAGFDENPVEDADDGEDEEGGTGAPMALDEGKMGTRDSERAVGQYQMKRAGAGPHLAREQAIEAARKAGILGTVHAERAGAFASLIDGDLGPVEVLVTVPLPASGDTSVTHGTPLVLADRGATADLVVRMLRLARGGTVAVSTDGSAHARALAVGFTMMPAPRASDAPELIVSLGPTDGEVAARHGASAVAGGFHWSGAADPAEVARHYAEARKTTPFADRTDVWLHIERPVKVARALALVTALRAAGAETIRIGDPSGASSTGFGGIRPSGPGVTIGHTSGPPGVLGRQASVPQVRIGSPSRVGDLDKAVIRRYIRRNLHEIRDCYEKRLLTAPKLEGTVRDDFVIAPDGTVASSKASGVDPEVASCIAAVVKAIQFPKPQGGGIVKVTYPFVFRPADP